MPRRTSIHVVRFTCARTAETMTMTDRRTGATTMRSNRADLAVAYATRSWQVFPLREGMKEPATRSGLYAGTDDLVTVRRWWGQHDYNIGINCGASDLFVVDLDIDDEKGDPGISSWLELCVEFGTQFEQTYCVNTPKGGTHVYYRTSNPLRSSTSELRPNIDTRGKGGYVVAAGSVVNDVEYESWGGDVPLPVPDWLAVRFRTEAEGDA